MSVKKLALPFQSRIAKNKGTITFAYHDLDQLNKIIEIIKENY